MAGDLTQEVAALHAVLVRAYPWFRDAGVNLTTSADPQGLGVIVVVRWGDMEARGRVRPRGPGPFDARHAVRWIHRWLHAAFLTPPRCCRTVRLMARRSPQSTKNDPKRVFISWSGEPSKAVATALYDWLPNVIQAIEPWMSQEAIHAGSRWGNEIAKELEACQTGILCVTHDNQHAPWLLFEAGALAKNMGTSHVCPYLIGGMKPSDVVGPLTQFQIKTADANGTLDVLKMINAGLGPDAVSQERLTANFELWWPKLGAALGALPPSAAPAHRDTREMLVEILETVRGLAIPPDLSYDVDELESRVTNIENSIGEPSIFGRAGIR